MKGLPIQVLTAKVQLMEARAQALELSHAVPSLEGDTKRSSFGAFMQRSLDQVNDALLTAQAQTQSFLKEEPGANLVDTMVAVNKAQVTFRTMVEVRNQLIQAYKDVANMPI